MSIAIKHLDGPLRGQSQEFDDFADSILVGRSAEAQIVYPEECIAVDGEHLRLNRDDAGYYRLELCGACDVEIDGRAAEDNEPVASGSVVTVGDGGPRFEILLPGLTVKHLEGPLAGQRQYFPESVAKVMFGRSREEAKIVYPADCATIGVKHFALNRNPAGDYHIELFGKRYVAMDGRPVIDGAMVKPGSVLRQGSSDGPSFRADIANIRPGYAKTAAQEEMLDADERIQETDERIRDTDERVHGVSVRTWAGLGALGVMLFGVIGWFGFYVPWHEEQVRKHLLQSVYLVVAKNPNGDKAEATAFLVGPGSFATNAHVTEALRGKVQAFYLLGPTGDKLAIKDVESHPGYAAFKAKAATYATPGSTSVEDFASAPLPSAYDVGLIYVDPATPLPEPLDVVSRDEALALEVGDDLVTAGFPSEDIRGADNLAKGLAEPTFRKGTIESLKDIFFSRSSEDPKNLLLVQHGIPVTGGMSGSPLLDAWSGKVVAIISGGNTKALSIAPQPKAGDGDTPDSLQKEKQKRITDAAQVNFSQRADLLSGLMSGTALAALAADQAYWEAIGAKFPRYFTLALDSFRSAADASYGDGEEIGVGRGVIVPGEKNEAMPWVKPAERTEPALLGESMLKAVPARKYGSHVYTLQAEPGFTYGFIVETTDALPLVLDKIFGPPLSFSLKQAEPSANELKPETAKLPLAMTVAVPSKTKLEIVLGGLLQKPVRYTLYAYRWPLPAALSTVNEPVPTTEALSPASAQ